MKLFACLALISAAGASASLAPLPHRGRLLALRGGGSAGGETSAASIVGRVVGWSKNPKPGKGPKIFPKLTGDGVDVVCGAAWGGATGAVLGTLIEGALSAVKYGVFTSAVIMVGQSNGLLEVHWDNVNRLKDRAITTTKDLIPVGEKAIDMRYGNGDGKLTSQDLRAEYAFVQGLAASNQHGAVGAGAAFTWFFLSSI